MYRLTQLRSKEPVTFFTTDVVNGIEVWWEGYHIEVEETAPCESRIIVKIGTIPLFEVATAGWTVTIERNHGQVVAERRDYDIEKATGTHSVTARLDENDELVVVTATRDGNVRELGIFISSNGRDIDIGIDVGECDEVARESYEGGVEHASHASAKEEAENGS